MGNNGLDINKHSSQMAQLCGTTANATAMITKLTQSFNKLYEIEIKALNAETQYNKKLLDTVSVMNSANGASKGFINSFDRVSKSIENTNKSFELTKTAFDGVGSMMVNKGFEIGSTLTAIAPVAGVAASALVATVQVFSAVQEAENEAKESLGLVADFEQSLDALDVKYRKLSELDRIGIIIANDSLKEQQENITNTNVELGVLLNLVNEIGKIDPKFFNGYNAYASKLVDSYNEISGSSFNINDYSGNPQKMTKNLIGNAKQAAADKKFETDYSNLMSSFESYAALDGEYVKQLTARNIATDAIENHEHLKNRKIINEYIGKSKENLPPGYEKHIGSGYEKAAINKMKESGVDYDSTKEDYDSLMKDYTKAEKELSAYYASKNIIDKNVIDTEESIVAYVKSLFSATSAEEAYNKALLNHEDALESVVQSYEESYNNALSTIKGRFGFDQTVDEISTGGMSAEELLGKSAEGLISQLEFSNTNRENFDKISNFSGVDFSSEMLSSIFSQGEYGASVAAAIAELIDVSETSENTDEVDSANLALSLYQGLFDELMVSQDLEAKTLGLIDSDFEGQMEALRGQMDAFVDGLTIDDDTLKGVAKDNISNLVDGFRKNGKDVEIAGSNLANSLIQEFRKAYKEPPVEANAIGTTNASNIFLAGEEGPELVVGAGGSRVFTAGATTDILSRAYNDAVTSVEASNRVYAASVNNDSFSRQEIHTNKTVTLKIEGGKSIAVDVNGFKDQFVDMLSENLRPVLVNIIEEDIFEEGEGSYNF